MLDKNSYNSDAIVDLYRSALYLARGSKEVGLSFFKKAKKVFGDKLDPRLNSLITNQELFKNKRNRFYWAEKILDEYHKLR